MATDPGSLGELDTGDDDGAGEGPGSSDGGATSESPVTSAGSESSGGHASEGGSESSGGHASEGGSESEGSSDTGERDTCDDPSLFPFEPATCPHPDAPILPAAGCYEPCEGLGAECTVGTCVAVQVNPCVCVEGEDCCEACASDQWLCVEGIADQVCEQIIGTTFRSIEELECGLGRGGVELCHWSIAFEDDGEYTWMYSDVGQAGAYACEGGVLAIDDAGIAVAYDSTTGILTWDGVEYVADPT